MLDLAAAIIGLVSDVLKLGVLFLRSSGVIRAENLVLRRELTRYIERGIRPQRVDLAKRVSLAQAPAAAIKERRSCMGGRKRAALREMRSR